MRDSHPCRLQYRVVGVYLEKMAVAAEADIGGAGGGSGGAGGGSGGAGREGLAEDSGVKVLMGNLFQKAKTRSLEVGCLDELTVRPLQDLQHHCWTSSMITIDRFPFLLISWCSDLNRTMVQVWPVHG